MCALLLGLPSLGWAQTIENTAFADYTVGGTAVTRPSNTHSTPLGIVRTNSTLELWQYAPGAAGATPIDINATDCSPSGSPAGGQPSGLPILPIDPIQDDFDAHPAELLIQNTLAQLL